MPSLQGHGKLASRARCPSRLPKSACPAAKSSVTGAARPARPGRQGLDERRFLERECHQAILKRAAGIAEAPNNGFYVPYGIQQRDMTATTGNAGGYVVATDNLAGSFIDLLRNRAVVAQLGATMMTILSAT